MISIIVPVYNGEETIKECLEALLDQSVARNEYEIIVVNDGSCDGTEELVRGYDVTLLPQPNLGPAAARNRGAREARGEILLFTDADCAPTYTWIEEMIRPLQNSEIVGVKGVYRTRQRGLLPRFVQLEYESKYDKMAKDRYIDFIDAYSAGYRRAIFEENGGFDPVFPVPSAEDVEFSFRLARKGYTMVFAPQAVVHHHHDVSIWEYLRRKFRYGYWRVLVYTRYPEKIVTDSHTPFSLKMQVGLLLLLSPVLMGTPFWPQLSVIASLAFLLFCLSMFPFCAHALRKDLPVGLISPALIFLRAAALAVGCAVGSVRMAAEKVRGDGYAESRNRELRSHLSTAPAQETTQEGMPS